MGGCNFSEQMEALETRRRISGFEAHFKFEILG